MAGKKAVLTYLIQTVFNVQGQKNIKGSTRDLEKMSQSLKTLGKGAFNIATEAAMMFTSALKQMGEQSIKVGADFENSIYVLGSIMGEPINKLGELSGKARELGSSTLFTATQAAQGMQMLARAGLDAGQVIGTVGSSLEFAGANMISMDTSTKIVTASMKQFGLQAGDVERITDTFTITAQNSLYSVEELATSFRYGGSVAAGFGATIEETASMLAQFRNLGLEASMAGVRFRQSMLALSAPTEKAKKAIENLGINADDINPRIVGLRQAFENLGEAGLKADDLVPIVNKISAADVAKISSEIYQMSTATAGATDNVTMLMNKISELRGRTSETYDTIKQSTLSTFKILTSNLQELQITLFDTFTANYSKDVKTNLDNIGAGYIELSDVINYANDVVTELGGAFKLLSLTFMNELTGLSDLLPKITAKDLAISITIATQNIMLLVAEFIKIIPILKSIGKTLIGLFAVGTIIQYGLALSRVVPVLIAMKTQLAATTLATLSFGGAIKAVIAAMTGPLGIVLAVTTAIAALVTFNGLLKKGTQNAIDQRLALQELSNMRLGLSQAEQVSQKGVSKSDQLTNVQDIMKDLKTANKLSGNLKGSLQGLRNLDPNKAIKESGKYLKAQVEINGKIRTIITDTLTLRRLEGVATNIVSTTYKDMYGTSLTLSQQEKTRLIELEGINKKYAEQRNLAADIFKDSRSIANMSGASTKDKLDEIGQMRQDLIDIQKVGSGFTGTLNERKVAAELLQKINTDFFIAMDQKTPVEESQLLLEKMTEQIETTYSKYNIGLEQSTKTLQQFKGSITGATTDMVINSKATKGTKISVKELNSELKKLLNELKKLKDFRVELRIDAENKIKILRGDLTEAGLENEKLTRKLLKNLDLEIEKTQRVQKLKLKTFQKGGVGQNFKNRPLTNDQQVTYNEALNKKLIEQYADYLATFESMQLEAEEKKLKIVKDFNEQKRIELQKAQMTERELLVREALESTEKTKRELDDKFYEIEQFEQAKLELYKKINQEIAGDRNKLALQSLKALNSVSDATRKELGVQGQAYNSYITDSIVNFTEYQLAVEDLVSSEERYENQAKLLKRIGEEGVLVNGVTKITAAGIKSLAEEFKTSETAMQDHITSFKNYEKMDLILFTGSMTKPFEEMQEEAKRNSRVYENIKQIEKEDITDIEKTYEANREKRFEEHENKIMEITKKAIRTRLELNEIAFNKEAKQLETQRLIEYAKTTSELLGEEQQYQNERKEFIKQNSADGSGNDKEIKNLLEQQEKDHQAKRLSIIRNMYEEMGYIDSEYYAKLGRLYNLDMSEYQIYAQNKNDIVSKSYDFESSMALKSNNFIFKLFNKQFSDYVQKRRDRLKLEEEYYGKIADLERKIASVKNEYSQTNDNGEKERLNTTLKSLVAQKSSATLNFNMAKQSTGFLAGAKKGLAYYKIAVDIFNGSVKGLISAFKGAVDFIMNVYSQLQSIISTFTGGFDIDPMSFLQDGTQAIIKDSEAAKIALEELEKRYAEGIITAEEYQEALSKGVGTANPEQAIVNYLQETVDNALEFISALEKAIPLLINRVKQAIPSVLNALKGVLPDVLGFLLDYIPFIATQLISFIVSLLPNVITTLSNQIPIIIKNLTNTFSSNLPNIINKLKKGLFNLLDGLTKPAEDSGKSILNNLIELAGNGLIQILEGAGELLEYLYPVLERLSPLLKQIFSDVVGVFFKEFPKYNKLLSKFLLGVVTGVIQAVIANLVPILGSIVQIIFQMLQQLTIELAREVLLSLASGIRDFMIGIAEDIKDAFGLGKTEEEKEEARESRKQKARDLLKEIASGTSAETETYGDTPQAIQAGTSGLLAKFAPGDYVIAAQNPINVASQAMELLSRGTTNAVARGIAPLTSPTSANAQTGSSGSSGYQNVNIKITADGKILDAITVNAMDKGNAPKLKKKIRKASGIKTGFDRGTYNRY